MITTLLIITLIVIAILGVASSPWWLLLIMVPTAIILVGASAIVETVCRITWSIVSYPYRKWVAYEDKRSREDYEDSPEAVYMLTVPGDIRADIRLDTNCAELDIFAIRWDRKDCPTRKHTRSIPQCEFNDKPGGGYLTITTVERPETYLIGADGKNGAHGNFRMAIECSTYR